MAFIENDLRKSRDEEEHRIILKILEDYKSADEIRSRIRQCREKIEKIAKDIVDMKISDSGDARRAMIGTMAAKDYTTFLRNFMIRFEIVNESEFNLDNFNKHIMISYLEAVIARYPGKFKELTDNISLWFKFLQTMKKLKTTEIGEVTQLYRDLVSKY